MERSEEDELEYTQRLIANHFSNYSAWHNRSYTEEARVPLQPSDHILVWGYYQPYRFHYFNPETAVPGSTPENVVGPPIAPPSCSAPGRTIGRFEHPKPVWKRKEKAIVDLQGERTSLMIKNIPSRFQ